MALAHHEIHFETYIVNKLVEHGWVEGDPEKYDKYRALYPEDVISWIKTTQADKWSKLEKINGSRTEDVLLDRLTKELAHKNGGTINILRKGFSCAGAGVIDMSQCEVEDKNNPSLMEKYESNILRVVRQLKYNPTREWSIDLVLFINGIPTATIELKTNFTQSLDAAITQYKLDRQPSYRLQGKKHDEPLLTFNRGAVVHFAVTENEIAMTTELKGEATHFLPFNKGNNGRKGNPPAPEGEYAVSYFWDEVCTPDNWLRIFHSFVYVETKKSTDKRGIQRESKRLIFPRYHQLESVNKMIQDVKAKGPGTCYLNEHSAGSGKTSTIAWTAHDLIKIRHDDGKPYFNSVIIVTDRRVLDEQLQDAVKQLDHQAGVIEAIDANRYGDSKSKRLAGALKSGAPIIVVTIQTFPFAMKLILEDASLKDKTFAVIVDEAHTSQTGTNVQGMKRTLAGDSEEELRAKSADEVLMEIQAQRGMPDNVSYFAFTATPKHSTFTLYGTRPHPDEPISEDNKPYAFHRYTQRQAIEEGYILDVLENYTPYREALRFADLNEQDKKVEKSKAKKALAKWKELHPTHVAQKVQFITDHFRNNVVDLLDGEAKAMVVTSGRAMAVKYKMAFDKYIATQGYQDMQALVAFSGSIKGSDLGVDDGELKLGFSQEAEYSEYNMNPSIGSKDLRAAFDEDEYNVMIVANKFQTGFNQPKLVAMYLDKRITGVEAVQTLSRLNRTYPGKDKTFVIDFVNDPQEILKAFKQYDEGAELHEVQDINAIYDQKLRLDAQDVYTFDDLENFKTKRNEVLLGLIPAAKSHQVLYSAIEKPAKFYNDKIAKLNDEKRRLDDLHDKAEKVKDDKGAEAIKVELDEVRAEIEEHESFRLGLNKFVKDYNFISQIVVLGDPDIENFSAFANLLHKRLEGLTEDDVDISGIKLTHYKIVPVDMPEGDDADPEGLKGAASGEGKKTLDEKEYMSKILQDLADAAGIHDEEQGEEFLNSISSFIRQDENIISQINVNPKEIAMQGDLPGKVSQFLWNEEEKSKAFIKAKNHIFKSQDHAMAFYSLVIDFINHQNAEGQGANR